jgi:succinylglutamate desuccinylase
MSELPPFVRELGRIRGVDPGPTLIVVGGVHGNEPAGALAAIDVIRRMEREAMDIRGEVVALAGNVAALNEKTRYRARDLNRAWTEQRLETLRLQAPELDDAEDREQRELLAAIDGAVARARGGIFLIDLHTTSAAGTPFIVFGDTLKQRAFGAHFPLPILLGLEEQLDGALSQLMTRRGCVTLAVEGGQHAAPDAREALEACIWLALDAAGLIERQRLQPWSSSHRLLTQRRGALPRVIEVLRRHAIRPEDSFEMAPGFANLAPAHHGQLLARDSNGEIRAESDGLVLLPLYQPQGDDGFFWGRPMSPQRLLASSVARHLRLDRLLPLLPGIEGEGDALEVCASVKDRYPESFFQAFGYRKQRERSDRISLCRQPE